MISWEEFRKFILVGCENETQGNNIVVVLGVYSIIWGLLVERN